MNMTKDVLWVKFTQLLCSEEVNLGYLFDFFSSDQLQELYEHIESELE